MKRLVFILVSAFLISCGGESQTIRIGYSCPYNNKGWSKVLYEEMLLESSLYGEENVQFIVKSAQSDSEQQYEDILDFYYEGNIDVLIVHLWDKEKVLPSIEFVYDKGLPVIVLDRKIRSEKITSKLGFSNIIFGQEAGEYAVNLLNGEGTVIEIMGNKEMTATMLRNKGFREVIDKYPGIEVLTGFYGNWVDSLVALKMDSILKIGVVPDLVYAHNDNMAYAAGKICEKYRVNPVIIGINGLPYPGGGIDMVLNGDIDVTFYNRPGGDIAIDLAMKIARGETVEKDIELKTFPIDKYNAESIREGFNLVQEQRIKFKRLQERVDILYDKIKYQKIVTYLILILLVFMALIVAITLFYLKHKQRYIKVIAQKNRDIENKIEEEQALAEELSAANSALMDQREEVVKKNEMLEQYRNNLEVIIDDRTKELTVALNKAKESDKLKDSFISNLSHEIRTPVNSIMGFSDLLFDNSYSVKERKNYHSQVVRSCYELMHIMENILEISIVASNQVEIKNDKINLGEFMTDFLQYLEHKYHSGFYEEVNSIEFFLDETPDITFASDKARLNQILDQLTNNAVKFTKQGRVIIGAKQQKPDNKVIFYVKDTGIGIDKKFHEVIFERFRKLEGDTSSLYRGNGLGLTISKFLVEKLGGKMWLESETGKGSVFYFSIGSKTGAESKVEGKPTLTRQKIENSTILIAEDESSHYLFLKALLSKYKVKTIWAKDGKEAIELYKQHPETNIVLMDIKMPNQDGIRALKEIHDIQPGLPVIAITAYAQVKDKERLLEKGFNDYISKPVIASVFIDTLKKYFL